MVEGRYNGTGRYNGGMGKDDIRVNGIIMVEEYNCEGEHNGGGKYSGRVEFNGGGRIEQGR